MTAEKAAFDNRPIPRKKSSSSSSSSNSSTKKRSAQVIKERDDVADDVPSNVAKRPRQTNDKDDNAPVYQKIKSGRTVGYPITVTQGGANRDSQHDAILLNCDDTNPEDYLAKFAHDDRVKIRWLHAGWNDFVAVGTIQLKKMDTSPPIRQAAANSGLLLQSESGMIAGEDTSMEMDDDDDDAPILKARRLNQMIEKGDEGENDKDEHYNDQEDHDEPLLCYTKTSSVGLLSRKGMSVSAGTENIEGGAGSDEKVVTHNNSNLGEDRTAGDELGEDWAGDGADVFAEALPQPVPSNMAVKTEDVDTDTEEPKQDKNEQIPESVASNMAIKTDDVDTDTEEPSQDKDERMPEAVASNIALKTDGIDTDDEATHHQDKDGLMPQPVASSMTIKTDDIDTDDEETHHQDKGGSITKTDDIGTDDEATHTGDAYDADALRDRMQAIVKKSGVNGDLLYQYDVRKALEKWFRCDLTKHQYDIYYVLNETIEKCFGRCPSWVGRGVIVEVRNQRRKGFVKGSNGNVISVKFDDTTTISVNYWHLTCVQPQVDDMVVVTAGEYLHAEGILVAVTGENAVLNISGNTTTVEFCSLAKIYKFGVGGGRRKIICFDCKVLKNANEFFNKFSRDQKQTNEAACCKWCKSREFLQCSICKVSKKRRDHFTAEQSNKQWGYCCMECEVLLVCSTCKVSKGSGLFSESQKSRGEAACCKKCEVIRECSVCKVSKSAGLFSRKSICKQCDVLVCSTCNVSKNVPTNFTAVQRLKGEAAVCHQCLKIAKSSRVCSACKLSKGEAHFTKGQKKKGEAACCKDCVEKVNTSLMCSMCKVWKKKSDHFTKAQKKKGEAACCKECEEVKTQTLAPVSANKIETPKPVADEQRNKGGKQRLCSACNIKKNYAEFSKNQLGKGEKARCRECVSGHQHLNK